MLTVALASGVSYAIGYGAAISLCVDVALKVTEIKIDPEILQQILIRYGNNI